MASLYDSDIFLRWGFEGPRPLAAYIHVPFCHHRCGYCNFSVVANREDLIQRYIDAVLIELSRLGTEQSVKTVFLGGGTPSILPREAMARLLEGVRRWLPIETGGEWSIEANPLDVTHENLKLWSSLGINRISLGGQSFQARKLMVLERDHSPEQLSRSIHVAAEWLRNVSLDLIFAAPEETLQEWEKDLALVLEHPLKHVSTYGLTYEKGARFWKIGRAHV